MHTPLVTQIDAAAEAAPEQGGLTTAQVNAIWKRLQALYDTKIYPAISFSLHRRGKVIMQRALGHSHGHGPGDVPQSPRRQMTPNTPVCLFFNFESGDRDAGAYFA
jgi:hypothetical protein